MKKIFVLYFILINLHVSGQVAKEHKEFLQNLYWDIPLGISLVQATKLFNESPVFQDVHVVLGQLEAYTISNPFFKLNSFFGENYDKQISFRMFFEENRKSTERRIIIRSQKSRQIGNTMVELLKSISYSMKITDKYKATNYEFYYKSDSKEPFFIIEIMTALVDDNAFEIWLSFVENRLSI